MCGLKDGRRFNNITIKMKLVRCFVFTGSVSNSTTTYDGAMNVTSRYNTGGYVQSTSVVTAVTEDLVRKETT